MKKIISIVEKRSSRTEMLLFGQFLPDKFFYYQLLPFNQFYLFLSSSLERAILELAAKFAQRIKKTLIGAASRKELRKLFISFAFAEWLGGSLSLSANEQVKANCLRRGVKESQL